MTGLTALHRNGDLKLVLNPDDEDLDGWETIGPLPAEIPPDLAFWNGTAIVARPLPVPDRVTPLQIRKAIRAAGLFDAVETFKASCAPEMLEAWEFASTIDRDDPMIATAAIAMSMSTADVDDLFRLAATF